MSTTALARFNAAIKGEAKGQATRCALPMVFGFAAKLAGVSVKVSLLEAEAMVQSQLQVQRTYCYDAIYVYGGNALEVEALGVPLVYPEEDYPYVDPHYQPTPIGQLLTVLLPDPTKQGRMPQMLQVAQKLHCEVGSHVPVVAVVSGPFTIAAQLIGLENLLYLIVDNPTKAQQLLAQMAKLCRNYAVALLDAGARVIMLMDPASSQSIITPGLFRQLSLPLIKDIFNTCRANGALACWLTITGKTEGFFKYYQQLGADLVTLDYEVSMGKALIELPQLALTGNLRPFDFIDQNPSDIKAQCLELLKLTTNRPNYILGTGCELPLNSKPENLAAMMEVLVND